jgi:hypothetical protein
VNTETSFPIVGWSLTRLGREQLDLARKSPAAWTPTIAPAPSLKHADDQTVTSLVAARRVCDQFAPIAIDFSDWGLVAAPRFLGRAAVGRTLRRYPVDGAWGVSMQLIPQHMLHSPASMLCIALGLKGAAIGAGGGPEGESEAAMAAIGILRQGAAGVWLVWSGWEPELIVSPTSEETSDARCVAVALAIQNSPNACSTSRLRLRNTPGANQEPPQKAFSLLARAEGIAEDSTTPFSHTFAICPEWRISIELPAPHPSTLSVAPVGSQSLDHSSPSPVVS